MIERKKICDEYQLILDRFIRGNISVDVLQLEFLQRFKNEKRKLDFELYSLLESIFGDIESFTKDEILLKESPEFFLDEKNLLEKIKFGAKCLESLGSK